jgi:threonine/homoserine/homoserine lactone efflux protein
MIRYIILGFVFAAGIGPVNIETAKRGLTGKIVPALFFYLGNVLIDALYILIIMFGSSFFIENKVIKVMLSIFGICYLLYLGINNIRDFYKKEILLTEDLQKKKKIHPALEGIMINLANPTAIASWLAFYSLVSENFNKSIFNFFAVIIGTILVGLVIITITYIFKRIIGEKVMRYITLIAGIVLLGFATIFTYNLIPF